MAGLSVSPMLIEILTRKEIENPTVSDIPGKYSKLISEKVEGFPMLTHKNEVLMTCRNCGYNSTYDVGTILVNKEKFKSEKETEDALQFSGYFRCAACNEAGNWEISKDLLIRVTSVIMASTGGVKDDRFGVGAYHLYDGSTHQFATDSEEYMLEKISERDEDGVEPSSEDLSLIWNKLGNLYWTGSRPDLAVAAFEQSLDLDAGHTESHFSLAQILHRADEIELAASHYRKMLIGARYYKGMEALEFRELLANGLLDSFAITAKTDGKIQALPIRDELNLTPAEADEFGDIFKLDFKPKLDDVASFYPVAEIFMGKRQKELPKEDRHYTPVVSMARLKQRKLQQKRRKKKKRR
ncbi:tetratricopeptide repeat protein [Alkalihalobacillus sp. AL-G]|uniref:tetratricopeptide repeat protein n=1 Tax=Alkalihalobacillus sp. AL-G TaxID=2926399 RepID=UPI00272B69F4|nr:tetratricopeptide repeat protein [Alkalihalobacillus sp. AL-G]WLD93099.1 tetratricopeptide repeat protein [Alkalihalobacillus sp. AL-G]